MNNLALVLANLGCLVIEAAAGLLARPILAAYSPLAGDAVALSLLGAAALGARWLFRRMPAYLGPEGAPCD